MYQSLALPSNQSYPHDSGSYTYPSGSQVYVPAPRVPAVLPGLSYLQGCEQSPGLAGHHGWTQGGGDASSFAPGSPHTAHGFSYPHSPPGSGGGSGRESGYQSPLVLGNMSRVHGGSYSGPYAYMSPDMGTSSWTPGPFESGVISLQGRHGALPGRRSSLGESH